MFCAEVVRSSISCCDKNDMICYRGEEKSIGLLWHWLSGMTNLYRKAVSNCVHAML